MSVSSSSTNTVWLKLVCPRPEAIYLLATKAARNYEQSNAAGRIECKRCVNLAGGRAEAKERPGRAASRPNAELFLDSPLDPLPHCERTPVQSFRSPGFCPANPPLFAGGARG